MFSALAGGEGAAVAATLPDVAANGTQGAESAELQAAAELVRLAGEWGVSLTSPDELLKHSRDRVKVSAQLTTGAAEKVVEEVTG